MSTALSPLYRITCAICTHTFEIRLALPPDPNLTATTACQICQTVGHCDVELVDSGCQLDLGAAMRNLNEHYKED